MTFQAFAPFNEQHSMSTFIFDIVEKIQGYVPEGHNQVVKIKNKTHQRTGQVGLRHQHAPSTILLNNSG